MTVHGSEVLFMANIVRSDMFEMICKKMRIMFRDFDLFGKEWYNKNSKNQFL